LKTVGASSLPKPQRAIVRRLIVSAPAHLSAMADAEPFGSLRTQLLDLAARYEEMAENLDIPRDG